jgi:large conductance mechanosensitive channel
MLKEFQQFISRGNALDLAVGIIIGGAFSGIVNSLVNDIIMPPIGVITGGVDFKDLFITLGAGHFASLADAKKAGVATLNYGAFVNSIINFFIVAVAIFFLIKSFNHFMKKKENAPPPPAPPTREVVVLEEIRDLLKQS